MFAIDVTEARMISFSAPGRCLIPCSIDDIRSVTCSFFGVMAKLRPRLSADFSVSFRILLDRFRTHLSSMIFESGVVTAGIILASLLACLDRLCRVSHCGYGMEVARSSKVRAMARLL